MQLLDNNDKKIYELDFGRLEAGKTQEYTYFIHNDSETKIVDIAISIAHKEIKILDYPKELNKQEKGKLLLSWSPSITLKEGLKSLVKISGYELYE